jgi:hypothetical protein
MRWKIPSPMLKYLYRTCPKCKDYLGVVVCDPPERMREIPIDAYCIVCGFKLRWRLGLEKKHVKTKGVIRDVSTGTN